MGVIVDAADGQRLHPMFSRDTAYKRPETCLQRRGDQLASASAAENTMKQGVDKCA